MTRTVKDLTPRLSDRVDDVEQPDLDTSVLATCGDRAGVPVGDDGPDVGDAEQDLSAVAG
jgi:hypothetical protein